MLLEKNAALSFAFSIAMAFSAAGQGGQEATKGSATNLTPWERVALEGVEAVNKNDTARFLAIAHPMLKDKLKQQALDMIQSKPDSTAAKEAVEKLGGGAHDRISSLPSDMFAKNWLSERESSISTVELEKLKKTEVRVLLSYPSKSGYSVKLEFTPPRGDQGSVEEPQPYTVTVTVLQDNGQWKYYGQFEAPPGDDGASGE